MAYPNLCHHVSLTIALYSLLVSAQKGMNILSFVNPMIGTSNGGNVFPGATLPYGMAKAVADVNGDNQGGYSEQGYNVTGMVCSSDLTSESNTFTRFQPYARFRNRRISFSRQLPTIPPSWLSG